MSSTNNELTSALRASPMEEDRPDATTELHRVYGNNQLPKVSVVLKPRLHPKSIEELYRLPPPIDQPAQSQSNASSELPNPKKRKLDQDSAGAINSVQPLMNSGQVPAEPASASVVANLLFKRNLIQQQLRLSLHANECRRRDAEDPQRGKCEQPKCTAMKTILNHIGNCQEGNACKFLHCSSTQKILRHWKHCTLKQCVVCKPLRQVGSHNLLLQHISEAAGSNWPIPMTLRTLIRMKLIEAILPNSISLQAFLDPKINEIIEFSNIVESRVYEAANSKERYARLLAGKIDKIRREVEQKREARRRREMRAVVEQRQREIQLLAYRHHQHRLHSRRCYRTRGS
ncbi:CREB-binding protein-like [Nasonia vitripennis]|uniref:histone acetyltransferase n=1 Tax=Nasonia vitripennis TaxID=7425 RepID=A0A7M7H7I5_NASVI|nr:CREB-binding protein-like [Nasonia vitripennis]